MRLRSVSECSDAGNSSSQLVDDFLSFRFSPRESVSVVETRPSSAREPASVFC